MMIFNRFEKDVEEAAPAGEAEVGPAWPETLDGLPHGYA